MNTPPTVKLNSALIFRLIQFLNEKAILKVSSLDKRRRDFTPYMNQEGKFKDFRINLKNEPRNQSFWISSCPKQYLQRLHHRFCIDFTQDINYFILSMFLDSLIKETRPGTHEFNLILNPSYSEFKSDDFKRLFRKMKQFNLTFYIDKRNFRIYTRENQSYPAIITLNEEVKVYQDKIFDFSIQPSKYIGDASLLINAGTKRIIELNCKNLEQQLNIFEKSKQTKVEEIILTVNSQEIFEQFFEKYYQKTTMKHLRLILKENLDLKRSLDILNRKQVQFDKIEAKNSTLSFRSIASLINSYESGLDCQIEIQKLVFDVTDFWNFGLLRVALNNQGQETCIEALSYIFYGDRNSIVKSDGKQNLKIKKVGFDVMVELRFVEFSKE